MKYTLYNLRACCLFVIVITALYPSRTVFALSNGESLNFNQVLGKILKTYPSLVIARRQVESAAYELDKVKSQLGWSFGADAGLKHDVSGFGTLSDQADINLSLERTLDSGSRVSVSGNYSYEDSSLTISPLLPNPSHSTTLDFSLRMPLAQGSNNAVYYEALNSAEAGLAIEGSRELANRDAVARQALELFYEAALTRERIRNAELAIVRAKRLKKYIAENFFLGLTENKDTLQADAQLQLQITETKRLLIAWEQQRISLNRLMGRGWDKEFLPVFDLNENMPEWDLTALYADVVQNNPDMALNVAVLEQAEAELGLKRDARKSQMDLVLSVGSRTSSGNSANGDVNEEDLAGQIRLEYRESLDKRGLDAEIQQAQLTRYIAQEQIRLIEDDLRYNTSSLVAQIKASVITLKSTKQQLVAEKKKYAEALQRYRNGRIETDRLIQFENELQQSVLAVKEQEIALRSLQQQLSLLRGTLWQSVELVN